LLRFFGFLLCKLDMDYDRKVHLAVDPSLSSVLLANLLADPYLSTSINASATWR